MKELIAHIEYLNVRGRFWQNEAEGRLVGMYVDDPEHWAAYGVFTVADFEQWEMDITYSDLHKDVYGFRSRRASHVSKEEYDALLRELDRVSEARASEEKEAIDQFEKLIADTIAMGAADRETAIRWLKSTDEWFENDPSYFEYHYHLPYGYLENPELRA